MVGPFARLASVVGLRSVVFFGLQAFIPVYFVHELGTSEAAGNAALSVMLVAGAAGTYVGGRLVDRLGRRVIVVGSMAVLGPLLIALQLVGRWPATLLLVGIGFVVIANFSITVVMGQEYLPNRLGLASGITVGARSASAASPRRGSARWRTRRASRRRCGRSRSCRCPRCCSRSRCRRPTTTAAYRPGNTKAPQSGAFCAGHGSPLTTSS